MLIRAVHNPDPDQPVAAADARTHLEVSILIVTFRNVELTRRCLESLRLSVAGLACETLIFDNNSADGTAEMIAAEFPDIKLTASPDNLGFAAANNRLAARATGEFLLLLNPDTLVPPNTIEPLLALARRHPEGGIYGGRTLSPSGVLDLSSCWAAPTLWSLVCFATGLSTFFPRSPLANPEAMPDWPRDTPRTVDIVTGCLALIPRSLWNEVSGFDEAFWLYGEDADLSMRVKARGYQPMITPDATITHVSGASSNPGARHVLLLGARVSLLRKHWRPSRVVIAKVLLMVGVAIRAPGGTQQGWREAWQRRREWQDPA